MRFLTIIFLWVAFNGMSQNMPLPNAHAHNDYESSRPLLNALENGFTSIEADVHLVEGKLYVSHDRPGVLNDDMLLENLYLKPLLQIAEERDGQIYPGYEAPVFLMIDFKTEAEDTYKALRSLVAPYRSILCRASEQHGRAVKIFISGNRPVERILSNREGYVALDGRPEDLAKNIDPALMPVISQSYESLNVADGKKSSGKTEAIKTLVMKAHHEGKKVRLWGAPDDETTWQHLLDLGVDLINTDKVEEFSLFMKRKD